MLNTVQHLVDLRLDAVKLHHLHVVRHTVLEKMYQRGELNLLTLDEYAALVADCIDLLPPQMLVMRLMGDAPRSMLVAPTGLKTNSLPCNELRQSWSVEIRFRANITIQPIGSQLTRKHHNLETIARIPGCSQRRLSYSWGLTI